MMNICPYVLSLPMHNSTHRAILPIYVNGIFAEPPIGSGTVFFDMIRQRVLANPRPSPNTDVGLRIVIGISFMNPVRIFSPSSLLSAYGESTGFIIFSVIPSPSRRPIAATLLICISCAAFISLQTSARFLTPSTLMDWKSALPCSVVSVAFAYPAALITTSPG